MRFLHRDLRPAHGEPAAGLPDRPADRGAELVARRRASWSSTATAGSTASRSPAPSELVEIDTGFARQVQQRPRHLAGRHAAGDQRPDRVDGQSASTPCRSAAARRARVTDKRPSYWHGWSPDGKTLAYCAERGGAWDVYTIGVDGGAETRVTEGIGASDGPDYTPDGKWIWFNSSRSGTHAALAHPPRRRRAAQMTDDARVNWFPHPSPDGNCVLYLAYENGVEGHPRDHDVELRLMDPDGGNIRTLSGALRRPGLDQRALLGARQPALRLRPLFGLEGPLPPRASDDAIHPPRPHRPRSQPHLLRHHVLRQEDRATAPGCSASTTPGRSTAPPGKAASTSSTPPTSTPRARRRRSPATLIKELAPREEIVLATKVFNRMRPGPNGMGLSRQAILHEIDMSLKRLGHRLRRSLPDPPPRPAHPVRGDDGGAARRGEGRQGPLYRRLVDVGLAVRQVPAGGRAQRLDESSSRCRTRSASSTARRSARCCRSAAPTASA